MDKFFTECAVCGKAMELTSEEYQAALVQSVFPELPCDECVLQGGDAKCQIE